MNDCKTAIKESVDIRDVVELYGVSLNSRGVCRCPFHDDRHPSANIKNGRFHCWVCDLHLDIFGFVQRMTGCGFVDAMRSINDVFHVVDMEQGHVDKEEIRCIMAERDAKKAKRDAECAEYDRKVEEYRILYWKTKGERPKTDEEAQQRAKELAMLERLEYFFDTHRRGR